MATYKVTAKLTGGMYYSSSFDEQLPQGSARYQKDWTMAARYDCTPYLYLKAEQHVMDGTELGFSITDNVSLQPNTLMTLLKLGVSF